MKKILFLLLLFFPLINYGQGFYIKNYDVSMHVMKSGQVNITERILVNFTEERRGIIRKIPTSYYISEHKESIFSTKAEPTNQHHIYISNLKSNRHFTNLNENGFTSLRIGDADKYLKGTQLYVISYSVEGIINPFDTHDELNWNIIGDRWDVPIKKISFTVNFEASNHGIQQKDVKITTGKTGSTDSDVNYSVGSSISGHSTREFKANEGMTISLRINKNYFSEFETIKNISTKVKINSNASCNVEELIIVKYNIHSNGFVYKIPKYRISKEGERKEIIAKNLKVSDNGNGYRHYKIKSDTNFELIHIGGNTDTENTLIGLDTIKLRYQIWGNIFKENKNTLFESSFFETKNKYSAIKQNLSIQFPQKTTINQQDVYRTNYPNSRNFKIGNTIDFKNNYSKKNLSLKFKLPSEQISSILPTKYIKNAEFFAVKNLNARIKIKENKEVSVHEKMELALLYSNMEYEHDLKFNSDYNYSSPKDYYRKNRGVDKIPNQRTAILRKYSTPLVYQEKINDKWGYMLYSETFYWSIQNSIEKSPILDFGYTLYDVICHSDSGSFISIPLFLEKEFIYGGECKVEFPKSINKTDIRCFIENSEGSYETNFKIENNTCLIDLSNLSQEFPELKVTILFPSDLIRGFSFAKESELFMLNNKVLLIPFAVFIVLGFLWFFIGKDYKHTLVVQYQPPENITPAEAGLLWDDRLHQRDMVSLIYYWASKGYMEVIENSGQLTFKKLENLPETAKQYEKTLFNALFTSGVIGSITSASSLKTEFAKKFKKAYSEMEKYSKKEGYYSRFANFISNLLFIFSVPIFFLGIILAFAEDNSAQYFVSFTITTVIVFFFGKIMKKKSLHASEIYAKIQGFKEFVEKAELDRLKIISQENPKYFEETIAYAIILGYGKLWAEKFTDLITEAPNWYKSDSETTQFTTSIFANDLVKSMYQMEKSFDYKPPKPKRTYSSNSYSSSKSSSYTSSWSKSSSSSSSWSGSSSFSSGSSGYSGSGYGGGGGSSW